MFASNWINNEPDICDIIVSKYRSNLSKQSRDKWKIDLIHQFIENIFEDTFINTFTKKIHKHIWLLLNEKLSRRDTRFGRVTNFTDSLLCVYRPCYDRITNNKKPIQSHFWSAQSSARNARVEWTSRDLWRNYHITRHHFREDKIVIVKKIYHFLRTRYLSNVALLIYRTLFLY